MPRYHYNGTDGDGKVTNGELWPVDQGQAMAILKRRFKNVSSGPVNSFWDRLESDHLVGWAVRLVRYCLDRETSDEERTRAEFDRLPAPP